MISDIFDEFFNAEKSDIPPFFEPGWNIWIWLGLWALLALSAFVASRAQDWWAMSDSLYGVPAAAAKGGAVIVTLAALYALFTLPFKMFRHTETWASFWLLLVALVALAAVVFFARTFEIVLDYGRGSALAPYAVAVLLPVLGIIAAITEAFTKFAGQIPTSVAGLMGLVGLAALGAIAFFIYAAATSRR